MAPGGSAIPVEGLTTQEETHFPMADQHPSAPARPRSGVPAAVPPSGVVHVRYRHTERFTVVGKHLAQHPDLSLTARGLGLYVQSLPDGVRIGIKFLAARFKEGEVLIASCLRELEAHGYLERINERISTNRWVTRTIAHDMPPFPVAAGASLPKGVLTTRLRVPEPVAVPTSIRAEATREPDRGQPPAPSTPVAPPPQHVPQPEPDRANPAPAPLAVHQAAPDILAGLRRYDPRLTLSEQDIARLAPAVTAWLERDVAPEAIERVLTARLPCAPIGFPAAFLGRRLVEQLPPPLPATRPERAVPRVVPMQNCDSCDRGFHDHEPGRCRDCRTAASPLFLRGSASRS
jgi:hypothetical protein